MRTARIDWMGYVYIFPVFLFLGLFVFWGMFYNFYVSFFEWDGIALEKTFVGLDNYIQLSKDSDFLDSLGNTAIFTVLYVTIVIVLGFFLSYFLHYNIIGKTFMKTMVFLPHVFPVSVIALLFYGFYDMNVGLLNDLLRGIGLGQLAAPWLGQMETSLYAVLAAFIFAQLGFTFMVYYTSLFSINEEVLEASHLDGSGFWRTSIEIVFPILKGVTLSLVITGIIATLKIFDIVWLMTQGGPGSSSELASTYVFKQAMMNYQQGYASAISVVLLAIAFVITAINLLIYVKGAKK
ncbi:carbohydrate ABC transporter permease [Paenibacillus puerhi]|uniref:carbohydrate ABC transporter permease n=1 Tax=Paenibacillus puerhi TaxID=2692622 RepID=UPI001359BBB1|nr:sugar ABC transporter permease [Paenibacillus puerhi]